MVAEAAQSPEARQARIIHCEFPDVEIPDISITDWVLRHLQRLDEAVVGLARPLKVPVAAPKR